MEGGRSKIAMLVTAGTSQLTSPSFNRYITISLPGLSFLNWHSNRCPVQNTFTSNSLTIVSWHSHRCVSESLRGVRRDKSWEDCALVESRDSIISILLMREKGRTGVGDRAYKIVRLLF